MKKDIDTKNFHSCRGITDDGNRGIYINSKFSVFCKDEIVSPIFDNSSTYGLFANYMDREGNYWLAEREYLYLFQDNKVTKQCPIPIGYSWAISKLNE